MTDQDLVEAGCSDRLIVSCIDLYGHERTDECLRLLKQHRSALVVAMHEAQKPIDMCDLIIRELERKGA